MAIYNNREVSVLGPNNMANSPETINVQHTNGSTENVPVSNVYFTDEEKAALVKKHPSKYDSVKTTKKEDVDAVRTGVAPSFDPSYLEAAKLKAQSEKQEELNKKNMEAAKKEADKQIAESKSTSPAPTVSNPQTVIKSK